MEGKRRLVNGAFICPLEEFGELLSNTYFLAQKLADHLFFFLLWFLQPHFVEMDQAELILPTCGREGNLRKTFSGREPQSLPCFLPAVTAQDGGRAAEDNVSRSMGVWVEGRGKEQSHGSALSLCWCSVQGVVGEQHNRAAEMGSTGLHTVVPGNIGSSNQALGLPCLVPRAAHGQPARKKIPTSLQVFSISSSLQLRN